MMDSVRWLNYLGTKDMTEQPKVAVLIGCYNHEDFIIPCLESVLSQTYSKVDIYIADDCSSDKTRDVIRNYIQKKDLRLHIIFNKENKGISENYNSLIEKALKDSEVEYIIPFAGDDLMREDKIERQVKALQAKPEVQLCYSNMKWFDSCTGKKIINHFNFIFKPTLSIDEIISDAIIPTPTLCIRRKALEVVRYNNALRYINDYLLSVELGILGNGVIYIDETLVFYRKHGSSIMDTKTFSEERRLAARIIIEKYGYIQAANRFSRTALYDEILESIYKKEITIFFKKTIFIFPCFFSSKKWFFRFLKLFYLINRTFVTKKQKC